MRRSNYSSTPDSDLKIKLTWGSVTRLIGLAAPYKYRLFASGLLMMVSTGVTLGLPLLIRVAVSRLEATHNASELDRYVLAMLGLLTLGSVLGYFQYLLSSYAGNRVIKDLRLKLFSHLQRLPVAYFDKKRSGDLSSSLSNDVSQLQTTLTDDLVRLPGHVIVLVGGISIGMWMNWRLAMIVVSVLAAMMAFFVVTGIATRLANRKALDALASTMGGITESLSNIRIVKAFAQEKHETARAESGLGEVLHLSMKSARIEGLMGTVGGAAFMLMLLGMLWYGGHGVLDGSLKISDIFGFLGAMFVISGPMAQIASLYTRLQRAVGASDRIFEILDQTPEIPDVPNAVGFPNGPGEVEFRNLRFAYELDTPVLKGLDLVLPAGKVTALVGPSGSGKSTVASLLFRFYEPQSGEISIDGVSVKDIRRHDLRDHLAIVPQDPILFNGTIRENIHYGRLDATDVEVEKAAQEANVAEFVNGFPNGYETIVGERGVTLSGGQRQRLAIARALLKNPRILVLDEATSALDTRSESLIREALDRLMVGRTTLIIAHRLTTIRNADQIAVLSGGEILETGTHNELLRLGGSYAGLYELVEA